MPAGNTFTDELPPAETGKEHEDFGTAAVATCFPGAGIELASQPVTYPLL